MSGSEWVYGSGRKGGPRKPINKEERMICPACGNEAKAYPDGTISLHKDYGKDKNGKPKKKGPWAYCKKRRWD